MGSLVYLLFLVSGLVLAGLSIAFEKKYKISKMWTEDKKPKDIFYYMACFLYGIYYKYCLKRKEKVFIFDFILQAPHVKKNLITLNPGTKAEKSMAQYYVQKIKNFLLIFYAGNIIALTISISSVRSGNICNENSVMKNAFGQGEKVIQTQCISEDGTTEDIEVVVEECCYTPEELELLFGEATHILEKKLAENTDDFNHVSKDLKLPDFLEGYPFQLKWESSDYFLMDHKGCIQKENISPEGELAVLSCTFYCQEWERQYQIPVKIFPPDYSEKEKWKKEIQKELMRVKKEQKYEKELILPLKITGKNVQWKEIKTNQSFILMILFVITGILIYYLRDQELYQETERRKDEMSKEYPVLINRLILYLGAGMALKSAWFKIAYDYQKNKKKNNYVYEEMMFTCHEIKSGVSENSAYEKFGDRCGLQEYTRLAGLLNQSVKKGNSALLKDMHQEAVRAQEERKNYVRKKGEEAGTKLLLPMTMMLGVVMVLIMLPAFLSFQM